MVKVGQTHRRHDAGEARDGGAMRKRATGHGRGRAWARWRALAPARRTVVVAAVPEVACTVDGDDRGGCRSSVELGVEATTAAGMRGWHLRLLRGAVRAWVCSVGRYGDCGHDGDEARRRRASAVVEDGARGREQGKRAKRRQQELTGRPMRWSASSGASSVLRIERRRSPAVAMKMAVMAWLQGTRRRVRRGRASRIQGGARGLTGWAWGCWWLRWCSSAVSVRPGMSEGERQRRERGCSE